MIKNSRKISVIIITALMIVSQLAIGAVIKVSQSNIFESTGSDYDPVGVSITERKQCETEMQRLEIELETAADEESAIAIRTSIAERKAGIYMYDLAISNEIDMWSDSFLVDVLNEIKNIKNSEYLKEAYVEMAKSSLSENPTDEELADYNSLTALLEAQSANRTGELAEYEAIVTQGSYERYIAVKDEEIRNNSDYTDEEKEIELRCNELRLAANPKGSTSNFTVESLVNDVGSEMRSLLHGLDADRNVPMTEDQKVQMENQLAVNVHKLENMAKTTDETDSADSINLDSEVYDILLNVGMIFVFILTIILAGSSVSQEIATGSIKSLIISPAKRWKIFLAKLASLVTISLAITVILYIVTNIVTLIFFGNGICTPYVYAVNGVAYEMNYYLYRFAEAMVNFIDVLVYLLFALMLSVVTRNTAVAVAVSLGLSLGGSTISSMLSMLSNNEIIKFLPFSNMGLTTKFFPFNNYDTLFSENLTHTLTFSLIYVAVMCTCIFVTAIDSFNRRDLK